MYSDLNAPSFNISENSYSVIMNFIQQKLAEQQKGKRFSNSKKPSGKLPKPSKNFKPTRSK